MTKRKTQPLHSAWMNANLTESTPVPGWLSEAEREQREHAHRDSESQAESDIRKRIEAEPGNIHPAPVIAALRRQLELFRLGRQRQEREPEVAQWAGLLRNIKVSDAPNYREVDTLRAQVSALPLHPAGVLNEALFLRAEIGRVALFERMMRDAGKLDGIASPVDVELLRGVLADMIDGLHYIRGKTGRNAHNDTGPAFRALVASIMKNAEGVKETAARALAAELLKDYGILITQDRTNLAKLAKLPPEN